MNKLLILTLSLTILSAHYISSNSLNQRLQSVADRVGNSGLVNSIRDSVNSTRSNLTGLARCNLISEQDSAEANGFCKYTVCPLGRGLDPILKQLNKVSPDSVRSISNACACACKSSGHPKAAKTLLHYANILD